jgi:hypothetical protein
MSLHEDRRPMSQTDFKRWLETEAAAAMFAWLRRRGRLIDHIRWPDREREGRPVHTKGEKTVDLVFNEDAREVGVDIIEMHESERHGRQNAEMTRIVGRLEREMAPRLRELNPTNTIAVDWHVRWLPNTKRVRAGLDMVKEALLEVAPILHAGDVIELQRKPDFIALLEVHCWPSQTPTFGFITMHEEQTEWLGAAAESMADSLLKSSKARQLKSFSDARVLAIDRALILFPAELSAAFEARRAQIPQNWTAIYFVIPGVPESLTEVWRDRRL